MKIYPPIGKSVLKSPALGNRPLIGDTEKMYRVGNDLYVWDDTAQLYVPVGSGTFYQAQYLTLALDSNLTQERLFTPGENMVGSDGGANAAYTLSAVIGALTPTSITVTPSTRQDDYNPTGWNSSYPNKATTMFLNPTTHIVIGGLQGGAQNRIAVLMNVSEKLIILENEGTGSSSANRFSFPKGMAHFLMPGRSVVLVYNTSLNKWVCQDSTSGYDVFTDFYQEGSPTSQMESVYWHTQASGTVSGGTTSAFGSALGSIILSTGAVSAAGNAKVSMLQRTSIVSNSVHKDYYLSACRIALANLSTSSSKYQAAFGMGQNGISSFSSTAPGAYWGIDIDRGGGYVTNYYCAAGASPSLSLSGLAFAINTWVTLGVFNSDFNEACFFYSQDGVTYVIDQVITASIPAIVTMNLVGIWSQNDAATAKRINVDFMGSSYKTVR